MDANVSDSEALSELSQIDLQKKLSALELDNKTLRDEFDAQRAKLKELFLQKEDDCKKLAHELNGVRQELNETKSQILVAEYKREHDIQNQDRRAQEEIASLQHVVHETIEENSVLKSEVDRLNAENERYRQICAQNAMTSQQRPQITSQTAQEDAEVLRSLVVPLEEEIKALKEKLRSTDEELQRCRSSSGSSLPSQNSNSALVGMLKESKSGQSLTPKVVDGENDGDEEATQDEASSEQATQCVMCKNYELQLVTAQGEQENLRKDIERFHEEAAKEAALRHDLEEKWQKKRDEYNEKVSTLEQEVQRNEEEMTALQRTYAAFKEEVNQELSRLMAERDSVHRQLTTLHDDNDFLAGRYLATSEEIESQMIDLPNSVNELQEMLLQNHQSLVEARVGCEFEQRKCASYVDEIQVLRDQLQTVVAERHAIERDFMARISKFESHVKAQENERLRLMSIKDAFEKKENETNKLLSELRVQVIELREANDKLEKQNMEVRGKLTVLQQDLTNSEAVQKDFVRLSQSLQMELEKIRAADTSVRWQDDDDVDTCPSCKTNFTVTRRKRNCRHCGTIYCEKCLTKSVVTGRNNKPARVCDVCHTLLERNTAPYFSQAPPQSPH